LVSLYLVSAEEGAGKTAIAAGIARRLAGDGKKVGFLKLVTGDKMPEGGERDAGFMKQLLGLKEPAEALSLLVGSGKSAADKIKEACASQDKDVIIIEGRCGQSPNDEFSQAAYEVAKALKAKVMAVEGYKQGAVLQFVHSYKGFGENLLGIILNKVPKSQLQRVCEEVTSSFGAGELAILGVLPEDRALLVLTVGELAGHIQGEILNDAEKSAELVENLMVGAMVVDSGLDYFGRKAGKAVVVRADRPDMQMAALETPTKCLVLTGGAGPVDYVRYKAEEKGVPLILTKSDTATVIQRIEDALDQARFGQEKKMSKLAEILEKNLDFQAVYKELGLIS
jgi:hypothetical protein